VTASSGGSGKRWTAQISYDNKRHYLGTFDTKHEAALAYDKAARQCGEDMPLNYERIAAEEAVVKVHIPAVWESGLRQSSEYRGVSWNKSSNKWKAQINYDGKRHYLGVFEDEEEAARAYDIAEKAHQDEKEQAEHTLVHDTCAGPKQPKPHPASGFNGVHASGKSSRKRPRKGENDCSLALKKVRPRPASGFYGVYASSGGSGKRWTAQISYDNKRHYLGTFDTKQEAALAYDRAARQCREDKPLHRSKPVNYESIAAAEAAVQAQAEHIRVDDTCAGPKQPKPRPASGFYGVFASSGGSGKRWTAQISYNNKRHYIGTFDTKHEAALAYDRAARQRGEDMPLNYESIAAAEAAVQAVPRQQRQQQRQLTGGGGAAAHDEELATTKRKCVAPVYLVHEQEGRKPQVGYHKQANDRKRPRKGGEDGRSLAQKKVRPRPASGFYGVYASSNGNGERWKAQITYDNKRHQMGTFNTKHEAALAYDKAARQCGEDMPLNYESIAAAEALLCVAASAVCTQVGSGG
jgi:uncharacterized protein YueI